jgi:hypothetical protein
MKLQYKELPGKVVSWDDANLTITHFISTETQDSGGDVMVAKGMVIRGKPVVLFQHGQDPVFGNEPIAKALSIVPGENEGKVGILATTKFFDDRKLTIPTCVGQRLYEKAKDDTMPNWSIGFNSIKATPIKGGRRVDEWELHEYSQVAVGMNKEATTLAMKKYGDLLAEPKFVVIPIIKCLGCSKEFDYAKEPEVSVGAVKCPGCGKNVDQTGKVLEEEKGGPSSEEAVKDLDEVEEIKSKKAPHELAHKNIYAMHKELVSDLKAFSKDDVTERGTEGCAKEAMDDFSDSVTPHVVKYIKCVRDMKKEATLPKIEAEEKGRPGSGPRPGHGKEGIEAVMADHSHNLETPLGKLEANLRTRIAGIQSDITAHTVDGKLPEGLQYLEDDLLSAQHDLVTMWHRVEDAHKSFDNNEKAYTAQHRALHAARNEMIKSIQTLTGNKACVPEAEAKKIVAEHHKCAMPLAKEFIKACHSPETNPVVPEKKPPILKLKPQAQVKVLKIKPTAKPKITVEVVAAMIAKSQAVVAETVTAELRRLSGKVTK